MTKRISLPAPAAEALAFALIIAALALVGA